MLQLTRPTVVGKFYICVHMGVDGFAAILCCKEEGRLKIHQYAKLGSEEICEREILKALSYLENCWNEMRLDGRRELKLYNFGGVHFGELSAIVNSLRKQYRKVSEYSYPFKEQRVEDDDYFRLKLSINSGEVRFSSDPEIGGRLDEGIAESNRNDFKITPLISALMIAAKVFRKNDSSFGAMKI
jgi:hypothetical protein